MPEITLATDGACKPNPGIGSWAYVLRYGEHFKQACGRHDDITTNNCMEIRAIVEGLSVIKRPSAVRVVTDSKVAIAWCRPNSFHKQSMREARPEAYRMVLRYRELAKIHDISFTLVKGHNGHYDNERCDWLCNSIISDGLISFLKKPADPDLFGFLPPGAETNAGYSEPSPGGGLLHC